jgi:putative mRNA 3-end processing factor
MPLLAHTPRGLCCAAGDFYVDPWRPVDRAVITHAHADHARPGHAAYLAAAPARGVMQSRLGANASIETMAYGETRDINGVKVSFHPAGHVLGSAQVRIEHRGEVWVVSGDYKLDFDPTCESFTPVKCDTFVSESTFGLPIYRWRAHLEMFEEINAWWAANAAVGRASVLFGYAFGKAQRMLKSVDANIGPIICHGAVEGLNRAYREAGVALPLTMMVSDTDKKFDYTRALVVAPPSAQGTPWLKRFGEYSDAFASGWMAIRGAKKQRNVDRGFVISDHADWPGLLKAICASEASRVLITHGQVPVMVRYLREQGIEADALETEFLGEGDVDDDSAQAPPSKPFLEAGEGVTAPSRDSREAWDEVARTRDAS